MAELKQALALRFDDAEARSELASLLLDRADVDGAVKLLGETLGLEPGALHPRLRAAELLSENGRSQEADAAYAQALALAPDDPEPHEQLGHHRLRARDDSGALAAFTRALSLRPQNPALRELVRSVRPESDTQRPTSTTRRPWRSLRRSPGRTSRCWPTCRWSRCSPTGSPRARTSW